MADFLGTVFGGAAQQEAADKNAAALAQYQSQAEDALKTGYATGTQNLTSAIGAYDPLAALGKQYSGAANLYLGALGAGGPQGTAAAQAAFTNAPGYQDAITAGLDAVKRMRGAGNMISSGNADEDALTFAQNLQNQQYNTWLQNLAGAGNTGVQATGAAAGGQAAGYTGLGQLGYQYGSDVGGIAGNVASGTMADNNMVAAGQAAGAKNLLGAGLSLASLAAGGFGGGGLGSLLGGGAGGVAAVPGAVGPTSLGGQPLGRSPSFFGGLFS